MARFKLELPTQIMSDVDRINGDSDKIFKAMVQAGAEHVLARVKSNLPAGIASSNMAKNLTITRPYNAPSYDGFGCKIAFYGYFKNRNGKIVPAPLVANVFEYGSSVHKKQPFFRKSFSPQAIRKVMLEAQLRASGGLLKNE